LKMLKTARKGMVQMAQLCILKRDMLVLAFYSGHQGWGVHKPKLISAQE
jgi:hypothetical protein